MSAVKRLARNCAGRDFIVGDIHGAFDELHAGLDRIGFNFTDDRLISVGDLVDRGPKNRDVVQMLRADWFHAVRGNHEDLTIKGVGEGSATHQTYVHMMNGGDWFYRLSEEEQGRIARALNQLPYAIEIETGNGLVGVVHAECPLADWTGFTTRLLTDDRMRKTAMWSRDRIEFGGQAIVRGVRAVVCGHTIVDTPTRVGNHHFIETAGWHKRGHFTFLNAETLEPA